MSWTEYPSSLSAIAMDLVPVFGNPAHITFILSEFKKSTVFYSTFFSILDHRLYIMNNYYSFNINYKKKFLTGKLLNLAVSFELSKVFKCSRM